MTETNRHNSSKRQRRFAFIPPRFGKDVAGGAETLVRELALALHQRGDYVEIWTTCAKDNRTWSNEWPDGESQESGLKVIRFPVDQRDLDRWVPLQIHISEGMNLAIEDQLDWMQESVNSQALYAHIIDQADQFDSIFFAPYLFGISFWGALLRPDKSVLIPCLHNESYAYLDIMHTCFTKVKGCLFNTAAEMELARSIYGNLAGAEVGKGFNLPTENAVVNLQPFFKDSFPYLLYLGRKETGKNVQTLIDYFLAGKANGALPAELKLVICGGGSFSDILRPQALEGGEIIDLEHVGEVDKLRLLKHAVSLFQPSLNESFSIVLMEAWSVHTPVVVHGHCAVTRQQVVNSGAGLYFTDANEFIAVTNWMLANPDERLKLGTAGRHYTADYYCWDRVVNRFYSAIDQIDCAKLASSSDFR